MAFQTPTDIANPTDLRLAKRVKLSEGNEEVALALGVIDSANEIITKCGQMRTNTNFGDDLRQTKMLDQGEKLYDVGLRMLEEANQKIEVALKDEVTTPVPIQNEGSQKTSSAGSERPDEPTSIEAQSVREYTETTSKDSAIVPVATHETTASKASLADLQDADKQTTEAAEPASKLFETELTDAANKTATTPKSTLVEADLANVEGADERATITEAEIKDESFENETERGTHTSSGESKKVEFSLISSEDEDEATDHMEDEDDDEALLYKETPSTSENERQNPRTKLHAKNIRHEDEASLGQAGDEDDEEALFFKETSLTGGEKGQNSPARFHSKNSRIEDEASLGEVEGDEDGEDLLFKETSSRNKSPPQLEESPAKVKAKKKRKQTTGRPKKVDDRCESCHKLLGLGKRSLTAGPTGGPQCIQCNNRRKSIDIRRLETTKE